MRPFIRFTGKIQRKSDNRVIWFDDEFYPEEMPRTEEAAIELLKKFQETLRGARFQYMIGDEPDESGRLFGRIWGNEAKGVMTKISYLAHNDPFGTPYLRKVIRGAIHLSDDDFRSISLFLKSFGMESEKENGEPVFR